MLLRLTSSFLWVFLIVDRSVCFQQKIRVFPTLRTRSTDVPMTIDSFLRSRQATTAELVVRDDAGSIDGILVKSLIWEYDGVPVLLVLQLDRLVDKAKLSEYLLVPPLSVGLVDRERAVKLAGYQIGTIPPCGLKSPLRTIIDAALLGSDGDADADFNFDPTDTVLYGGSGSTNLQLRVTLSELMHLSAGEVADISTEGSSKGTKPVHQQLRATSRLSTNSPPPPTPTPPPAPAPARIRQQGATTDATTSATASAAASAAASASASFHAPTAIPPASSESGPARHVVDKAVKQARKEVWEAQRKQKKTDEVTAGFSVKLLRDHAVLADSPKFFEILALYDREPEVHRSELDVATPSGKTGTYSITPDP
jgi:prolyl-tRNA editing enzyme YbaK/EbsC (Cys-tRNA(Pro) deacylase)